MKILSYQGTPQSADISLNLKTVETTMLAAKTLSVDVVVFPELFVTGYNIGAEIKILAQSLDGEICQTLQRIAKREGVGLVIGWPEREGENIFNSAIAIDKSGQIVGHHRKVFLFGDEEKALFTPGNDFFVFSLDGEQCGLSICYDIEFPESIRTLAKKGARVIFNPTANMYPYTEVPKTLARARALENNVVVVYSNLCGQENGLRYTGLSAIISSEGVDLARAGCEQAIIVADISASLSSNTTPIGATQLMDLKASKFKPT